MTNEIKPAKPLTDLEKQILHHLMFTIKKSIARF